MKSIFCLIVCLFSPLGFAQMVDLENTDINTDNLEDHDRLFYRSAYERAVDALNGNGDISLEDLTGYWVLQYDEVRIYDCVLSSTTYNPERFEDRAFIDALGNDTSFELELTEEGNLHIDTPPSMSLIPDGGYAGPVELGDGTTGFFGKYNPNTAIAGFTGEDGVDYIASFHRESIGDQCPTIQVYTRY